MGFEAALLPTLVLAGMGMVYFAAGSGWKFSMRLKQKIY
jgi:hypothetical protein